MNSGKLRESVTIQQKSETVSDSGNVTISWVTYVSVHAGIRTASGKEFFGNDKFNAQVSHMVEIRWYSGVTPQMRVLWGSRVLNIKHISEDNRHGRTMWLYCEEAKD